MNVTVFSESRNISKCFSALEKSREHELEYRPLSELRKTVKGMGKGSFIYVDISGMDGPERKKTLNYLAKLEEPGYGIIDPKGAVTDMAHLFYSGARDYIGKELYRSGIGVKRFALTASFRRDPEEVEDAGKPQVKRDYLFSGSDWKGIKSGQEYTFIFMFIEIDNKSEIRKMGQARASQVTAEFHDYVADKVAPLNGKIWMWMDFGGLILFPFDGKGCDPILEAFKMVLDSSIASSEEFALDFRLTHRIALHIGNTVYKSRGNTGTIVSDSINSIFHLGQKFAGKGDFCITGEVSEFIPRGLEKCFADAGTFEAREIKKMILPV